MPLTIRHITALSLALMVWTSTIGFNMHLLYCFCKEEWKVSLFELKDSCSVEKQSKTKDCCKSHKGCSAKNEQSEFQKTPCESTSVQFVKISDKFLSSKEAGKEISPFTDHYCPIPSSGEFSAVHNPPLTDLNKAPPVPYGRTLLTFLQLMRC